MIAAGKSMGSVRRVGADECGFTILELLVSTLVGLTVLGGLTGAVISQGRSMATQRGLADAQAMGRGTNEILMQDLRMAGYGMLGVNPDDDLPPIEVSAEEAAEMQLQHGDKCAVETTADGTDRVGKRSA